MRKGQTAEITAWKNRARGLLHAKRIQCVRERLFEISLPQPGTDQDKNPSTRFRATQSLHQDIQDENCLYIPQGIAAERRAPPLGLTQSLTRQEDGQQS